MSSDEESKALAVVNCSQVVTLAGPARARVGAEMGQLGVVAPGALLIRGHRIERIGTTDQILAAADPACKVVDACGRVVLPGFVDAHTHPVFAGTRVDEFEERIKGATYQEIAARGGGIQSTVAKTRGASLDELVTTGKRYASWILRGGTTTVEAKSGYGLSLEGEIKILRAIKRLDQETPLRYVPTFLGAHTIPPEYRNRRSDYVSLLIEDRKSV